MKTSNKKQFYESLKQQEESINHKYDSSYADDDYNKNLIRNMERDIMLNQILCNLMISKN